MNREEELTDILRKVEWGQLDSAVAFDRILLLFNVAGQNEQSNVFEWLKDNYSIVVPDRVIDEYKQYNGNDEKLPVIKST